MYRLQAAAKQLRLHKDVAHALDTYGNVPYEKQYNFRLKTHARGDYTCKKQWWYVVVKSEDISVHSLPLIAGVSGLAG